MLASGQNRGLPLMVSYQEDRQGLAVSGEDDELRDTTGEGLGTLIGTFLELAVVYATGRWSAGILSPPVP